MMKALKAARLLCCVVCLFILMSAACALAEETRISGKVELFGEGAFPQTDASFSAYASDRLEAFLADQLLSAADPIDVSAYSLTPEAFAALYENLLNSRPELFHVKSDYACELSPSGEVLRLYPQYHYTGSTLSTRASSYNKALNAIVDYANKSDTVIGKLLRANDYICAHYEYDTSYSIYTAEEMFETGRGVCQAYMLAYKAVLNKLGVRNATATSWAMNHTWNAVYLDDAWYHIDVTWNDPIIAGRLVPFYVSHDHFLLSDEGITDSGHYSWSGVSAAVNTQYDQAAWKKLNQPAGMIDDLFYYADGNTSPYSPTIYMYDLETHQQKKIINYKLPYDFGVYYSCFPVWPTRSNLYYVSANKLYVMPRSGGASKVVYTAGTDEQIWFTFLDGLELTMLLSDDPYYGEHRFETILLEDGCEVVMNASVVELTAGQAHQLTADLVPAQSGISFTWHSSNPDAVTVDASGGLKAVKRGASLITATCTKDSELSACCLVKVVGDTVMTIPSNTYRIDDKAFFGAGMQEVILPQGVNVISTQAFANCSDLRLITLPPTLYYIADDAFSGTSGVTAICTTADTAGLAQAHGFTVVQLPEGFIGF